LNSRLNQLSFLYGRPGQVTLLRVPPQPQRPRSLAAVLLRAPPPSLSGGVGSKSSSIGCARLGGEVPPPPPPPPPSPPPPPPPPPLLLLLLLLGVIKEEMVVLRFFQLIAVLSSLNPSCFVLVAALPPLPLPPGLCCVPRVRVVFRPFFWCHRLVLFFIFDNVFSVVYPTLTALPEDIIDHGLAFYNRKGRACSTSCKTAFRRKVPR